MIDIKPPIGKPVKEDENNNALKELAQPDPIISTVNNEIEELRIKSVGAIEEKPAESTDTIVNTENEAPVLMIKFVCERFSGFMFRYGTRRYRFVRHVLEVPENEAVEIRKMLKEIPAMGQKIKEVNLAQAEALVREHMRTHGGAVKGPLNTETMRKAEMMQLDNRDAAFANINPNDKQDLVDALRKDSDLIITEQQKSS